MDAEVKVRPRRGQTAPARNQSKQAPRPGELRFRTIVDHTTAGVVQADACGLMTLVNRRWCEMIGYSEAELLEMNIADITHPECLDDTLEAVARLAAGGPDFEMEKRYRRKDGSTLWATSSVSALRDPAGEFVGLVAVVLDISQRKRAEAVQAAQRSVMELAVKDAPLAEVLDRLVRTVEAQSRSEMLGSILLLDADGMHLRHGAAPSLPNTYNEAIDGIEIGPGVGSCGTAAHSGQPVYVSDIAADPLWKDFAGLALSHGLRACWSTPILSGHGEVLGTFAMYYRARREPSGPDLELVEMVTRSAALIIERKRTHEALLQKTRRLEAKDRIARAISRHLDLEHIVQTVTDSATELSGAKFGAFFYNLTDEKGERYSLYTLSGAPREAFDRFGMPRNTQVFEPTFRGTTVVRSDDIRKDPRYGKMGPHYGMPEGHLPVVSYLAVPVVSGSGEVHGGLFFAHDKPGVFTKESEDIVTGIAAHAAIALDNAHLLNAAQAELAQRRRAEEALRESERQARDLLAALPTAIYTTDADGRITYFNEAAVEFAGRRPELGSDSWCVTWRLYWPDGTPLPHDECPMATALKEGRAIYGAEACAERPDGTRVPFLAYPTPLRDESGKVTGAINMLVDITDRKHAEEQRTLLINELNHRVKNTLATVQSMASQSLRHNDDTEEARRQFEARLMALSKAHDVLTREKWEHANIRDIVTNAIEPHRGNGRDPFEVDGPDLMMAPRAVLSLSIALHELSTNAIKYGSLSNDAGTVRIEWSIDGADSDRRLTMRWSEAGGPPVTPPSRRGFGSRYIESGLSQDLGGEVRVEFAPSGLVCRVDAPLEGNHA